MIRRGSSRLAFSLPAAGVVGGVGAARERTNAALIGRAFGPPFGNQDIRIAFGQFQSIADFRIFETDAIDHFGVLANETDGGCFITATIATAVVAVFATRRLVSDTLPFTRAFPVHLVGLTY
ncbi:MAG TPA: hypothetical protein VFO21_16620 [Vicinamibacterales bacterium]|nr:hypothetical protein [Vicinamibacterales bacterium]